MPSLSNPLVIALRDTFKSRRCLGPADDFDE